jgi:hypothetical protein
MKVIDEYWVGALQMSGRPNSRSDFHTNCCTGMILGSTQAGYNFTQVLLRRPARGASYRRRLHPWRVHPWWVVVCVWSVVVLNNSAPSLAVAGWLQDRYCDKFHS